MVGFFSLSLFPLSPSQDNNKHIADFIYQDAMMWVHCRKTVVIIRTAAAHLKAERNHIFVARNPVITARRLYPSKFCGQRSNPHDEIAKFGNRSI
jgi:hypothetical protein